MSLGCMAGPVFCCATTSCWSNLQCSTFGGGWVPQSHEQQRRNVTMCPISGAGFLVAKFNAGVGRQTCARTGRDCSDGFGEEKLLRSRFWSTFRVHNQVRGGGSNSTVEFWTRKLSAKMTALYSHGLVCIEREFSYAFSQGSSSRKQSSHLFVTAAAKVPQNVDLPLVLPKNKKKPYATPKQVVKRRRPGPRLEPTLKAPANGLLVKHCIPIAHDVMEAKAILTKGIDLLLKAIPVWTCRFCSEVHVGSVGHDLQTCRGPRNDHRHSFHDWVKGNIDDVLVLVQAYHLVDRLALPIPHEQRFDVDRIPAIDELCIQAGVDILEYPAKRYSKSIKSLIRERKTGASWMGEEFTFFLAHENFGPDESPERDDLEETSWAGGEDAVDAQVDAPARNQIIENEEVEEQRIVTKPLLEPSYDSFRKEEEKLLLDVTSEDDLQTVAQKTLQAWDRMRAGVRKLKSKYRVVACGYCPEIHVGPKGHRARVCGAFKHQWRAGKHGWQTASLDELIPPQYVWHLRDMHGPPLYNALRTFYGKAPAIVELCAQAGAPVPDIYRPLMRLDIAIPTLDELENVI